MEIIASSKEMSGLSKYIRHPWDFLGGRNGVRAQQREIDRIIDVLRVSS